MLDSIAQPARDGHGDLQVVTAALPAAVDAALQKTAPHKYTPELARQIADAMTTELHASATRPPTAAERGNDWLLRYGCNPDCQLDHAGDDGEPGWHSTIPVETAMRDIDDNSSPAENETLPFLGTQIVVDNYRAQAYGRRTLVWLHYGRTTGTLTPAKAREALAEMRGFVAEFEAVVDQAEQIAVDDFEGDPEVARLDREAERRRIAAIDKARAEARG